MKTIELTITKTRKPWQIIKTLRDKNLKRGDRLMIKRKGKEAQPEMIVIVVLILIIWYFNNQSKKKKSFGDEVEEMMFDKTISPAILEKQVEKEYGIKVEVEPVEDEEEFFWQQLAIRSMSKAYDRDEADYSDVKLMEPNPTYKPWRKAQ